MTADDPSTTMTTVYVCVTCRSAGETADLSEARAGRRLFDALAAELAADGAVDLIPVECLSVCKRPCSVGFSAPGKWTYVYGDLPAETAAPILVEAVRLYGAAADGLIPWKMRPAALKTGVVARVPPRHEARNAPRGQAA